MVHQQQAIVALSALKPQRREAWGDYTFHAQTHSIFFGDELIPTTAKEFALAHLLFQNIGRPLARTSILEAVWGCGADTTSRTLDAHISQVRMRLRLHAKNGFLLSSVYGFGYRLECLSDWELTAPRGVGARAPLKI